jgi:serine/threonine protein kinase/tetratricopeptide (TPR) repeat protein
VTIGSARETTVLYRPAEGRAVAGLMIPTLAPGSHLGPYTCLNVLGHGGMGVVYRARENGTGDVVALKTVRGLVSFQLSRIRREMAALGQVEHPGVVRIREAGVSDGVPWYAMEFIEGATFHEYLRTRMSPTDRPGSADVPTDPASTRDAQSGVGPDLTMAGADLELSAAPLAATEPASSVPDTIAATDPGPSAASTSPSRSAGYDPARRDVALRLVARLCETLAYLHGQGIVHRDLKPSNVLVAPGERPILVDFGLAAHFDAEGRERLQAGGEVEGTVGYMAPEQIRGEYVDARADLFAVGCMLYECLTGHLPFRATTLGSLRLAHEAGDPPPPSELGAQADPSLDALVMRLISTRPSQRLAYAIDVLAELEREGVAAGRWPGAPEPRPHLYRASFVGRAAVLDQVEREVRHVLDTRPGCVLVDGESGVGKTRLMMELTRSLRRDDVRVIASVCAQVGGGRSGEAGASAPLQPFRAVLQAVVDHCLEHGREESDRVVGHRGKLLAPYAPELAGLPGQDAYPDPVELPAEAARFRLLEALGETLEALAADGPLVVLIDDLQWADELSLSFLTLFQTGAWDAQRMAILAGMRSEDVDRVVGPYRRVFREAVQVSLRRLDEEAVAEIVREMLGSDSADDRLVAFLARHCGGNPFFVSESLRAAVARGVLTRAPLAQWRLQEAGDDAATAGIESLPLPVSMHELIARRLDDLPARARDLAELAAAIGRVFDSRLVPLTPRFEERTALEALDTLVQAHFLEETADDGQYRFTHDKFREIAYDRLSESRRRDLHRQAAEAMEALDSSPEQRSEAAPRLAHQWIEAGDPARAVNWLELAGQQALEAGAYGLAIEHFTRLLSIDDEAQVGGGPATPSLRRARWERRLAEALSREGRVAEARTHTERAVATLGRPAPASRGGKIVGLSAHVARQALRRLSPLPFRGPGPREARDHLRETANAYDLMTRMAYYMGDPLAAFHASIAQLNLAERAGPSPELATAYCMIAGMCTMLPAPRWAAMYLRRGREVLAAAGTPPVAIWFGLIESTVHLSMARWDEAEACLDRSLAIAREIGDTRSVEDLLGVGSNCAMLRGEIDLALERAVEESTLAHRRGDIQTEAYGRLLQLGCLLTKGQLDAARECQSQVAERLATGELGRMETAWGRSLDAVVALQAGTFDAADRLAHEAESLLRACGPPLVWYMTLAYRGPAEVRLSLWERSLADPAASSASRRRAGLSARDACRFFHRTGRVLPVAASAASNFWGRYHALAGRTGRARAAFRRALELARTHAQPLDEAHAERGLGRLAATREEAAQHLRRAVSLFETHLVEGPALDAVRLDLGRLGPSPATTTTPDRNPPPGS